MFGLSGQLWRVFKQLTVPALDYGRGNIVWNVGEGFHIFTLQWIVSTQKSSNLNWLLAKYYYFLIDALTPSWTPQILPLKSSTLSCPKQPWDANMQHSRNGDKLSVCKCSDDIFTIYEKCNVIFSGSLEVWRYNIVIKVMKRDCSNNYKVWQKYIDLLSGNNTSNISSSGKFQIIHERNFPYTALIFVIFARLLYPALISYKTDSLKET